VVIAASRPAGGCRASAVPPGSPLIASDGMRSVSAILSLTASDGARSPRSICERYGLEMPTNEASCRSGRAARRRQLLTFLPTQTYGHMYCPPLTEKICPVMKLASGSARNSTVRAISSGSPSRPTGIFAITRSRASFGTAVTISVEM
jgi:hypothetical protein